MDNTVTATDKKVATSTGFARKAMYGLESVCLPQGCYEASLLLDSESSKPATAAGIPMCDVFLTPLHTSQLFCIEESQPILDKVTSSVLRIFPENPCFSVCERQPHITFKATLVEEEGTGWSGAYYAITPYVPVPIPIEAKDAYENRDTVGHLSGTEGLSAVAAGTLDWTFQEEDLICVPIQILDTTQQQQPNTQSQSQTHTQSLTQPQTQKQPPSCFTIQLSIPAASKLNPLMGFSDSWSIPTGMNYYQGKYCTSCTCY